MSQATQFRSAAGAREVHDSYRRLIKTHLPFAESHIISTSAGSTFVLSAGPVEGSPIILLAGSGSVAASWAPEMREFSRSYRVHAVDLPGESGLSTSERLALHPGIHAGWLHEVTSALGAERAVVVGVSLGAWVAMDYASSFPVNVQELALFSPSGIGARRVGPLLIAVLLSTLGDAGRRRALAYLLGPNAPAWSSPFHEDLGALALATFRHFKPRTDAIPTFSDEALRRLPQALTVVLGERDRMLDGPGAARRLQALQQPGRIECLSGRGHLVPQKPYLEHLLA